MKFTVFGASGFIGSALAASLRRAGRSVRTPARSARVPSGDLGHVFYCVGVTSDFRRRPLDAMEAHVSALLPLLRSARFKSFLYLSSTRVYLGARRAAESSPLSVDPNRPDDLYALSKLAGESACLSDPRAGVRVARLSNVYGPGDRSGNFLDSVVGDALRGSVRFRTAPSSSKDYVALEDVVSLLPQIAARGRRRLYNVAAGREATNAAVARELRALTGCRTSFAPGAPRLAFPRVSTSLVRAEFGFKPTSFSDGLARLVAARADRRTPGSRS